MRGLSQAALVFGSVLSLALMGTVPSARAQRYPSKTIEIVVSYETVLLGPKGMPGNVVELLQRETALALADPQVRASLAVQGVEPSQTQDVRAFLARERAKFGRMMRELAIAMD
jgi:tripartite-type tricarboxylate transporter receptor subunit TctC